MAAAGAAKVALLQGGIALIRPRWAVALAASCLVSLGCAGGLGCGGLGGDTCASQCADNCRDGCSYAGMKYECCEATCCSARQPGCGDCADACAGNCGAANCRQPCVRTLLQKLCGCTGCGEMYWNEWHCDPPACREPCDCMGAYAGKCNGACCR